MIADIRIFGVRIDAFRNDAELYAKLEEFLHNGKTNAVFTPNPEILLAARGNTDFQKTLNAADLSLPDGFGVSLVNFIQTGTWIRRYPGIDAAHLLLRIAKKTNLPVMLFGGRQDAATKATKRLRERFPGLRVSAAGEDVCFRNDGSACDAETRQRLHDAIQNYAPTILLAGLGAPKQENWIMRHKDNFPSVRIMMATGGAFDIWSGRLRRAPKAMRALGLEWLWRLFQEPPRLSRIFRATALFPWYALKEKIRG